MNLTFTTEFASQALAEIREVSDQCISRIASIAYGLLCKGTLPGGGLNLLSLIPNRPLLPLPPKNTVRHAETPNILSQILAPVRARDARERVLADGVAVEADAARRAEPARPAQLLTDTVARPRAALVQSALPDVLAELQRPGGGEGEGQACDEEVVDVHGGF